ncbi:hypothetical protein [Aeromicrobium sp. UC242_57]|uniref:hypothetical protein n=1 Tax=Aeromicrobium sp. UC242_57 TaxID=3374624 RepID=UPI0037BE72DC
MAKASLRVSAWAWRSTTGAMVSPRPARRASTRAVISRVTLSAISSWITGSSARGATLLR